MSSPDHQTGNRNWHQKGNVNNFEATTASVDKRERTILRNNVAPMKRLTWEQSEGSSLPLGVTWIEAEQAFNFAIHSEHAESVTLLLYAPTGSGEPAADVPF